MLKILKAQAHDKAYDFAAKEFQRLYYEITGVKLPTTKNFNAHDDFIVIGSDAVNNNVFKMRERDIHPGLSIRYGTDDYQILSATKSERNYLFLAGGRGRSTIYAVYDFFERQANCRYYWDGDVIPKQTTVAIDHLNIIERPRLHYRGLRYFAHRSLHRFQAEHWNYEDWQKEINWILKKRLNLFMLRIGLDDVFQKAFPEAVDYPQPNEHLEENKLGGYNDRTSFWSLKYRGELRKKILDYAFECDLMHPDDIGPVTHWYSRTPHQFLDHHNPDFLDQTTTGYAEKSGLVWDIRKQKNLDNYFKLAETHVKEYGRGELFHTIGLAERMMYDDRKKNLELKCLAYRQISLYLKKHYPNAPLLLASWDFWMYWEAEELEKLCEQLDDQQAIILDYTTDAPDSWNDSFSQNLDFTKWRKEQNFPWIAGIFHAFEPSTEIRNNYHFVQHRLTQAFADTNCRGLIYWPECSHTDSLMIEYFTSCAWQGKAMDIETVLSDFCHSRYDDQSKAMLSIWNELLPLSSSGSWQGIRTEFFFDFDSKWLEESNFSEFYKHWKFLSQNKEKLSTNAFNVLTALTSIKPERTPFLKRDMIDIARTAIARHIGLGLLNIITQLDAWRNKHSAELKKYLTLQQKHLLELFNSLADVLGTSEEFSLYHSLERMRSTAPVHQDFEQTLKENANNGYCRSFIYELVRYLYIPEMEKVLRIIDSQLNNPAHHNDSANQAFQEAKKSIHEQFRTISLKEMAPRINSNDFPKILKKAAERCVKLEIK